MGAPTQSDSLCPGCGKPVDALRAGHVAKYANVVASQPSGANDTYLHRARQKPTPRSLASMNSRK